MVAGRALTKIVRREVMKEHVHRRVLVVATEALRETLGRDVLATVKPKLEAVLALDPGDVVGRLVEVLNGELGSVAVDAKGEAVLIGVERQEGELVQAGVGEVSGHFGVAVAVEPKAKLVGQIRREEVVLGESKQVPLEGLLRIKRRQE